MANSFLLNVKRLDLLVDKITKKKLDVSKKLTKDEYYDFKKLQADQTRQQIAALIEALKKQRSALAPQLMDRPEGEKEIFSALQLLQTIENGFKRNEIKEMKKATEQLLNVASSFHQPEEKEHQTPTFILPPLPKEVEEEVRSDVNELEKCFEAGCYRSCAILCGRLLETALHRKYYEETGQDVLEKNPGIGLGNLVAKLNEKNIFDDPGITQQIHLINQVRIFSVHKKKGAFNPSKHQVQAMMLYTLDVFNKLFKA